MVTGQEVLSDCDHNSTFYINHLIFMYTYRAHCECPAHRYLRTLCMYPSLVPTRSRPLGPQTTGHSVPHYCRDYPGDDGRYEVTVY